MKRILLTTTVFAFFSAPLSSAFAQDTGVAVRIQKLEEELALLKRQQEVQEEKDKASAEKAASVEFRKKGLKITSPDKKYEMTLRGTMQVDGRHFFKDENKTGRDDVLARRLRPVLEVRAGDASFRLMPDFAGSTTRIYDAHADYKLTDSIQFRFGKFKPPIGLERLQSAADLTFVERSHPTNLAPTRDFGVMLYGNPLPDVLEYQLGLFNGTPDLGNTDGDSDDKKDVVARVFTQPFRNADTVALQGLGFGLAGSYGARNGSASNTILGTYKTPGQQDFFRYRSDTYADGTHWRLFPQATWYYGSVGVLGEYAVSDQAVSRSVSHATLQHHAWQVEGSYVLTGEDANFKGGVKPSEDFSFSGNGIGAWELAARVGATDVDHAAFSVFSDPAVAARKAQSYGAGLNWYLNENLKLMADYDLTRFEGGATAGGDRPDEQALFTRAQFRF